MQRLCYLADIPDGGSRGALPGPRGRDRLVLVRQGARVFAYRNNCPHYDRAPLGWKKDAFLSGDSRHIMCAAHGALFRVSDGVCELGPCLGQQLEAVAVCVREDAVFLTSPL